jgi:hypothetical protein
MFAVIIGRSAQQSLFTFYKHLWKKKKSGADGEPLAHVSLESALAGNFN